MKKIDVASYAIAAAITLPTAVTIGETLYEARYDQILKESYSLPYDKQQGYIDRNSALALAGSIGLDFTSSAALAAINWALIRGVLEIVKEGLND